MLYSFVMVTSFFLVIVAPISKVSANEIDAQRILSIVENKDFRTYFNISFDLQMEVKSIKYNKPEVLWPKLIEKFYDDVYHQVSKISRTESDLGIFFGSREVSSFKELEYLISHKHETNILESRAKIWYNDRHVNTFEYRKGKVVYVLISYKDKNDSPFINRKPLKVTIIELLFDNRTGFFVRSSRVKEGDKFWNELDYLLPSKVIQKLEARFKEWSLPIYGRDIWAFFKKEGVRYKPYCIWGDFDGNGKVDFTVYIISRAQREPKNFILVYMQDRQNNFKEYTLASWQVERSGISRRYLWLYKKGSLGMNFEKQKRFKFGNDTIGLWVHNISSRAYIYKDGTFESLFTSD